MLLDVYLIRRPSQLSVQGRASGAMPRWLAGNSMLDAPGSLGSLRGWA